MTNVMRSGKSGCGRDGGENVGWLSHFERGFEEGCFESSTD